MTEKELKIFEIRKAVCRKISLAIKQKGWTQKQFAKEWGKPEPWVSNILTAKVDLSLSSMAEIERVLDIVLLNYS